MKSLKSITGELAGKTVSRRSFLKSMAAAGAAASVFGCSKGDDGEIIYTGGGNPDIEIPETGEAKYFYGSSSHNCGGRCTTRAEVVNGTIRRFLSDESMMSAEGSYLNGESRNYPQTKACARCRSYKYRLYHPGRLKYPLKQTIKRGDLNGFKRISWEQALKEITDKHKEVFKKYGTDGIYAIYACGHDTSPYESASSGPVARKNGIDNTPYGNALRLMGNSQTVYFSNYSAHQFQFLAYGYTGAWPVGAMDMPANNVARFTDNIVMWGNNSLSTRNPQAYASVRAVEDMKKRCQGEDGKGRAVFVGPEFSDTGVTCADEWYVAKPYTDSAIIAGMIYHMLENTFNLETGAPLPDPWLDIDYLDTMVYGFFDSPAYNLNESDGTISPVNGAPAAGSRNVNEVGRGRSYCSWILGSSTGKTYSETSASSNYTAAKYAEIDPSFTRWAPCSYTVNKAPVTEGGAAASVYKTKRDYLTPKTPEWASAISGVPETAIKRLAELYAKGGQILSLWSGGMQKQAEGVIALFALQALHVITKNVYKQGASIAWYITPTIKKASGITMSVSGEDYSGTLEVEKPAASCTAWHNAIKLAYGDELKERGYTGQYIPDWGVDNIGKGKVYHDDGGAKAMLAWERDGDGKVITDNNTGYFKYKTDTDGTPLYAGIRLMYNTGGNIFINQHQNSNDSREMLECLPLNNGDSDTFCLVSFDNFLSPTPMYSDYVLPAATNWEQGDIVSPTNSTPIYMPVVTPPPGESKSTWDFAEALLEAYESGLSKNITGGHPLEYHVKKAFQKASSNVDSGYYGKTWDEYLENPYLAAEEDNYKVSPACMLQPMLPESIMPIVSMDSYSNADKKTAFIKRSAGHYVIMDDAGSSSNISTALSGDYGNQYLQSSIDQAPKSPLRFAVYSDVFVWNYEHRFEKWHGYMAASGNTGQKNEDMFEKDPIVLPIPMYFAYEDYFYEAYNGELPAEGNRFLLTTTHDRYRSHSSMAENPLLRELSHKVPGVRKNVDNPAFPYTRDEDTLKPAGDYGHYASAPERAFEEGGSGQYPAYNSAIAPDGSVSQENKEIASYSEIWMNKADAAGMGIQNGDLVDVWNKIGAVRCVAKLTKRCAKGFLGLHQGCWYDIREIPGSGTGHKYIDVGGNCNTLMASKPSRADHGNGQQSAMVSVKKVENY